MLALLNSQVEFPVSFSEEDLENGLRRINEALLALSPDQKKLVTDVLSSSEGGKLVNGVVGCSPFLTSLMVRNIDFLPVLFTSDPMLLIEQVMAEVSVFRGENVDDLKRMLRQSKGKIALITAFADIGGVWNLNWVTSALSNFADGAVKAAINFLLRKAIAKGEIDCGSMDDPAASSGLVILGMGKLGSLELNYSSDIDLIVFFEKERAKFSETVNPKKFYVKLAQEMVSILHDRTEDGYVFRTDLRLRPDPSSTPVAMSVAGALTYYETVGQNWERAAMIKARQVAGDKVAGEFFFKNIVPYVWRKNLDFAAIRDIHSIKRQIDARLEADLNSYKGFNVKLGSGGIREIEFFVQTQQLIWGGKQPSLRIKATCDALNELAELGHISAGTKDELTHNYHALRKIEHRLQMIADEQTHTIPESDTGYMRAANFCGFKLISDFEKLLKKITSSTHTKYSEIFNESPQLADKGNLVFTGVENDLNTIDTIRKMGYNDPEYVSTAIRAWHHGNRRSTRTKKARELITELVPTILKTFGAMPDPDQAFRNFDDFIAKLPAVSQIFSLFTSNPPLLSLIAEILGTSPYLNELLTRKPSRVDSILYPRFFVTPPPAEEMSSEVASLVVINKDYEEKLDVIRRYTNERQLQVGVQLLKGLIDPLKAREVLTDVADVALTECLDIAKQEFAEKYGEVAGGSLSIVGMGKLGGRELSFNSDLDIVFVYDADDESSVSSGDKAFQPNVYYMRLAQRVLGSFTSITDEGRLYEVDTRLRPHGNKGPMAVNLDGYERYYSDSAWPVELLALSRARVIGVETHGDDKLSDVIRRIISKGVDKDELKKQVVDVRSKILEQHKPKNILDVKYLRGGLLDVELIAQYITMVNAFNKSEVLSTNTIEQITNAEKYGFMASEQAVQLLQAAKLYQSLQLILQIVGQEVGEDVKLNPAIINAIGIGDFNGLKERLNFVCEKVYKIFQAIFLNS